MKKIGILFGQERSFPEAVINRINEKAEKGITAEAVKIDITNMLKNPNQLVLEWEQLPLIE